MPGGGGGACAPFARMEGAPPPPEVRGAMPPMPGGGGAMPLPDCGPMPMLMGVPLEGTGGGPPGPMPGGGGGMPPSGPPIMPGGRIEPTLLGGGGTPPCMHKQRCRRFDTHHALRCTLRHTAPGIWPARRTARPHAAALSWLRLLTGIGGGGPPPPRLIARIASTGGRGKPAEGGPPAKGGGGMPPGAPPGGGGPPGPGNGGRGAPCEGGPAASTREVAEVSRLDQHRSTRAFHNSPLHTDPLQVDCPGYYSFNAFLLRLQRIVQLFCTLARPWAPCTQDRVDTSRQLPAESPAAHLPSGLQQKGAEPCLGAVGDSSYCTACLAPDLADLKAFVLRSLLVNY